MDVSLRGVRKTYRGGITALDRLDLDIPPGLFGLLGPNGAGKTTLMRILAGVSRPDRGSVRAGDWDRGRPRERRQFQGQLGYLPRDLGLYPELSGRRFLDYAGTLKGLSSPRRRRRRVDEVLGLTGLDAVADRPAGGDSGGMRRRLGLARAADGLVWSVQTDRPLSAAQAAAVVSAVRLPDRTVYRVIAPAPPLPSAQPLRPRLEDGYLALIRRRGAGPR